MSIIFNIVTANNHAINYNIGIGVNDTNAVMQFNAIRVELAKTMDVEFDVHQYVRVDGHEVDVIDLGNGEGCRYCTYRKNGRNYIGHYSNDAALERVEVFATPIENINSITDEMIGVIEKINTAYAWAFI